MLALLRAGKIGDDGTQHRVTACAQKPLKREQKHEQTIGSRRLGLASQTAGDNTWPWHMSRRQLLNMNYMG